MKRTHFLCFGLVIINILMVLGLGFTVFKFKRLTDRLRSETERHRIVEVKNFILEEEENGKCRESNSGESDKGDASEGVRPSCSA